MSYLILFIVIIHRRCLSHYNDVTMSVIASQITSLGIVYSIVYSGADQRKHQSSAALAFVRRIHRGPVNSPHKRPVTRKMFPFHDVIMLFLVKFIPSTRGYCKEVQTSLRLRHNERDCVSNHQPHDYLLNRLFRRRSKKTSKLIVTGVWGEGGIHRSPVNSPHKRPVTRKMFPFYDVIILILLSRYRLPLPVIF